MLTEMIHACIILLFSIVIHFFNLIFYGCFFRNILFH
ncbi:unnamed protein product [Arabidopsis halleri]